MSFNGQFNGRGFANRNWGNQQWNGNRSNGNNFQQAQPYKKKSGAEHKKGRKKDGSDFTVTYGWKYFKGQGITKYFCFEYKGSREVTSNTGRKWLTVMCEAFNMKTNSRDLKPAIMDMQSGKVICQSMGLVINPKGGRGGVVARIGAKPRN